MMRIDIVEGNAAPVSVYSYIRLAGRHDKLTLATSTNLLNLEAVSSTPSSPNANTLYFITET